MTLINRKIQSQRFKRQNLSNSTKSKKPDSSNTNPTDRIEIAIKEASSMWGDLKDRIKTNPEFIELKDEEKVNIFQKKYKDFYTEFPIVSRYMVCMGQYSNKAFKRYLIKCKSVKPVPPQERVEGYTEDQWVQRQADYVRYLWESYQTQHFSSSDAQGIWQHAYQTLKKEFKDFKDMHKVIEEKLKSEDKIGKAELVKELLQRLSDQSSGQSLDDDTTEKLVGMLKEKALNRRKTNLINQINEDVELIPPTRIAQGMRKELKSASDIDPHPNPKVNPVVSNRGV